MSFVVGGVGGLTLIETEAVSALSYDPVVGSFRELSGRLFYEVLPDVYTLLADQELLPHIWEGYVQAVADLLLAAICADASYSLLNVPIDFQRKYQHIDLEFEQDLLSDPDPTYLGRGAERFVYSTDTSTLDFSCIGKLSTDAAYWPLRSEIDHRALLRWSFRASFSTMEESSYALFGYFSTQLLGGLFIGVGDAGKVSVVQAYPFTEGVRGESNAFITPVTLEEDIDYDFDVTYGPETVLTLTVTRVSDSVKVLDEYTCKIQDGEYFEYFTADAFGVLNFNTAKIPLPFVRSGRKVTGHLGAFSYLDPSVDRTIQALPFLQDEWLNPETFWSDTVEYDFRTAPFYESEGPISDPDPDPCFIEFSEQPPDFLLAEYVSFNLELIEKNFGLDVGLSGDNTATYKSQVQALHSAYWKGPTLRSIQLGVQALLGLPFAEEGGTVTSVSTMYDGDHGSIIIAGTKGQKLYLFPRTVTPLVAEDDIVEKFQPLTTGVEVYDWKNRPDWFVPFLDDVYSPSSDVFSTALNWHTKAGYPRNELEKYHFFMVSIDNAVFELTALPSVQAFFENIRQTYKSVVLNIYKNLIDTLDSNDTLTLEVGLNLWDHLGGTETLSPHYGDPGEPPYTWQYGEEGLKYGMYYWLCPGNPLYLKLTNVSGVPQTVYWLGETVTIPAGDFVEDTV